MWHSPLIPTSLLNDFFLKLEVMFFFIVEIFELKTFDVYLIILLTFS